MHPITFQYEIKGKILQVVASCKSILNGEDVEGLSLTFLNENDERVKVSYDKEVFEDLEHEAVYLLAEEYYNPPVNFERGH